MRVAQTSARVAQTLIEQYEVVECRRQSIQRDFSFSHDRGVWMRCIPRDDTLCLRQLSRSASFCPFDDGSAGPRKTPQGSARLRKAPQGSAKLLKTLHGSIQSCTARTRSAISRHAHGLEPPKSQHGLKLPKSQHGLTLCKILRDCHFFCCCARVVKVVCIRF